MSTVKIKTEPTTTTTAIVDVKVKLEPSLSTADIKLEQHTSDIDTKVESDSDAGSEEGEEDDIKSESDDSDGDEDTDQDQFTIIPKTVHRFRCEHPGCSRGFNNTSHLRLHHHEHRLQTELVLDRETYTLARQSLSDRWTCPFSDCETTWKTINSLCGHIRRAHDSAKKQQLQSLARMIQFHLYFAGVDDFKVNKVRSGYHNSTGVFICYECRLVPECLLSHLQQKHGYNEKSIDNSVLPESARISGNDPSVNQHISNPHLTAAISQSYRQQHRDIVQGWQCITSDCGYCGLTASTKSNHKRDIHHGEHLTTVPALLLGLVYANSKSCYFFVAGIDKAGSAVTTSSDRMSQHKLDYNHNGLNVQDENEDDFSQNETTKASSQKRQWMCEYNDCRRLFNSISGLSAHRREHKLKYVIGVHDSTYTLTRQSSGDRWPCPIPDCETTCKTIPNTRIHIKKAHNKSLKHKHSSMERDNNYQQQQQGIKKRQLAIHYLSVDWFYACGARCGYHTLTGLFICHECRLVPECLLTHLQQKHEFDEKSIDNSALPESAVNAGTDPNINQHTNNLHLASAAAQPHWQRHLDIVQGWLCVTSDCGYCGHTKMSRSQHHRREHRGEQLSTVPALVLRLLYGEKQTACFLITRLDTIITHSVDSSNSTNQQNNECDDGDELVLSDYSDENDIH